jgi:hypothetical protein
MAIKVARGQVTIIDQNDAVSLQAFIGSSQPLTQVFNKDTGAYAPSWAASPYLILTPSLFVSGKAAVDQISSVGNAATLTAGVKSGSAKWYKDGTVITSGQDSFSLSEISDNRSDSLSIPTASDAMFKATTSRSENLGTTPRLGTFPDSLTKLPAICLHMFSNFANIAYKLCIRYLSIKSLVTFNLLNINNMHNFLNINLL